MPARPVGAAFRTIVLGPSGGLFEASLSSYLIGAAGSDAFVSLDAGVMLDGLRVAKERGSLSDLGPPPGVSSTVEAWVLRERIKAVFLSHPHLDHVSGLVLSSPEDGPKILAGLDPTIDTVRDHLFNNSVWANFADEGTEPRLKRYHYLRLAAGAVTPIAGTSLAVEAWPLAHAGGLSTAFLITSGEASALYLGDTGPDVVEGSNRLASLWARVSPLVRSRSLRAIFLEVSFADGRPDRTLFGHLTPAHLMSELGVLARSASPENPSLSGVTLVVTHIKPALDGSDPVATIASQVKTRNTLGLKVVIPRQGETLWF